MQTQLLEMSVLAQLIGRIGTQRVEFDVNVQQAAFQVIGQSIVHRNVTPANQLLEVIGAHLKTPLVAYLEKFGNVAWSKSDKKLVFFDVGRLAGSPLVWTDEYAEKVASFVWTKAKVEVQPKSVFDATDEFERLIDRAAKMGKKGGEIKDRSLLEKIIAVFNRYQAEKILGSTTALPTAEDVQVTAAAGASPEALQKLQEHFGGVPTPVEKAA